MYWIEINWKTKLSLRQASIMILSMYIIDLIEFTVEHESMSMYIKAFCEVNTQKLINNSKIKLEGIERRKIGFIFMQFYRYR